MQSIWRLLILVAGAGLAGCTEPVPSTVFLSFTENESGEPYPVRMLVTDKYLRIEDGDGQSGFVLLDRAHRTVYSVNHPARTTLVIRAEPVRLAVPKRFEHRIERNPAALPPVDGRSVLHYRLLTNDERCFEVYAADGLLPQALAALREYHQVLAGEQAVMQAHVPADLQSACDLAEYVFLPTRHLAQGFPVRQVNRAGVTRQLVDYKTGVAAEPKLFELPGGYKQIVPAEVRR